LSVHSGAEVIQSGSGFAHQQAVAGVVPDVVLEEFQ
jgi:hypothetical protein